MKKVVSVPSFHQGSSLSSSSLMHPPQFHGIHQTPSSSALYSSAQDHHTAHKRKKAHHREPITYYELLELERQRNEANQAASVKIKIKRTFPIAPDGFIPNSVVKKFFKLLDSASAKQTEKKIWKLKWKPPPEAVKEEQENLVEPEVYNPQEFYLDLSSEEEEEAVEVEDYEEEDSHLSDSEKFLRELSKVLSEYEWFDLRGRDFSIENAVKTLVNKLIERNPSNHSTIVRILIDIISKLKLDTDLIYWMVNQLEDELDGTSTEIITNSVKVIAALKVETYNFDSAMLNLLTNQTFKSDDLKSSIFEYFQNVCDVNEKGVELTLENIKRFHNPKYKKLVDFKLKRFVDEYEAEQEAINRRKNAAVDEITESDTFKLILKEDWIADAVKESLKCLRDYLNFLLKSLKTVKSKIFYEKVANYLNALFNEFNLANSTWEKEIINHFVQSNTDPKIAEQLRLVDIDNLAKYFPSTNDQNLKSDVLVELLRSASVEKNRPQVMESAKVHLKPLSNLIDYDVEGIIAFYQVHSANIASKNIKFTWQELLHLYRTQPRISERELLEMKGFSGAMVESSSNDLDSGLGSSLESSSLIKSKSKPGAVAGKKNKKDKAGGRSGEKPEMIKEKTEPPPQTIETKADKTTKEKNKSVISKDKEPSLVGVKSEKDKKTKTKDEVISEERKPQTKKTPDGKSVRKDEKIIDDDIEESHLKDMSLIDDSTNEERKKKTKRKKETSFEDHDEKTSSKGKLSLLPNTTKGWEYYRKRSDRERDLNELSKHSLAEQHEPMVYSNSNIDESLLAKEYEKEYERLRRQASYEEKLLYEGGGGRQYEDDDDIEFDNIVEVTSSLDSLIDDTERRRSASTHKKNISPAGDDRSPRREKSSREILDGITRRVIMSQMSGKPSPSRSHRRRRRRQERDEDYVDDYETSTTTKRKASIPAAAPSSHLPPIRNQLEDVSFRLNAFWNEANEKAHFIDVSSYYDDEPILEQGLRLAALAQHKKRQLINYNKLLECLIIRGLELHEHYEKLLPQSQSHREGEGGFVQIPFETDFLVVHPYNKKNSYAYNHMEPHFKSTWMDSSGAFGQTMQQQPQQQQTTHQNTRAPFPVEGETARIEFLSNNNVFQGLRRRAKRKEHFYRQVDKARIGDFDLNHIFLINKLLISYGAENIREFYSTLNSDLRFYLRRLHTRIPHKIIPLIWNDPVIQKLALILSTSYQFKSRAANKKEPKPQQQELTLKKAQILPTIKNMGRYEDEMRERKLMVTNSLNLVSTTKNKLDNDKNLDPLKLPKMGKLHPLSYDFSRHGGRYPYNLWPLFKQEDTNRTKAVKKKLYCHLMNSKHDYIRLQWRYMLQEENLKKSNLSYLPPLSLKVNLNTH